MVRLHPDTVETVKQRADIVDVVSERVVLKKNGKDFKGLCPFHDDKSPSFTVSATKGFYYCFSCGAGGNAIKFLMELDKRSFGDVVLDLARRYQVPVQTLEPEQRQEIQRQITEREQLYEVLAVAAGFYAHALTQPVGARAMDYLLEERQLRQDTIQAFNLGYSPAGWDALYRYLVDQKRYAVSLVEKAGLIVPRKAGGGYYDRFRDRLMVPIRDPQGRTIGFGGRTLNGDEPKYLNSPETELFDKGKTLFGLDQAKTAIAKTDAAIVVEGYFDVIALHAAGIENAVAALGTALSLAQVKLLTRFTESKQIILNFDADSAGQKATERAIGEVEGLAYRGEIQLRVLNLPGGKDADEFLKTYSPDHYRTLIADAPLWLDWQLDRAIGSRDLRLADQFQAAVGDAVKLLSQLPNPATRSHYIRRCADLLGQKDSYFTLQLEQDLRSQVQGQRWHGRSAKWQRLGDSSLRESAEGQLLRIYLHLPDRRQQILAILEERELEFGLSHHRFLWRQILQLQDQWGQEATELAIELRSNPDLSHEDLAMVDRLLSLDERTLLDLDRPGLTIRAAIATIESLQCAKRCRHLLDAWLSHYLQTEVAAEALRRVFAGEPPIGSGNDKVISLRGGGGGGGGGGVAGNLALAPDPIDLERLEENLNRAYEQQQTFHDLYYQERRYLQQLQQERFTSFEDLAQNPSDGSISPLNQLF
ncbi:DNA primase [Limnothrix redekei]|uniref:DNA primase n=1 Tax=Limnothrix redekei TaxID=132606 RepID=UPI0037107A1C